MSRYGEDIEYFENKSAALEELLIAVIEAFNKGHSREVVSLLQMAADAISEDHQLLAEQEMEEETIH